MSKTSVNLRAELRYTIGRLLGESAYYVESWGAVINANPRLRQIALRLRAALTVAGIDVPPKSPRRRKAGRK